MTDPYTTFALVTGAHFLALLSPGPDFFLIVRSALRHGLARTVPVCVGIATANALYIGLALGSFALLQPEGRAIVAFRWAGAAWLLWLGIRLLCSRADDGAPPTSGSAHAQGQAFVAGFLSALLNPKNPLFYASLFALLGSAGSPELRVLCAIWMFAAVLGWDLLVAGLLSRPALTHRFRTRIHVIERASGAIFILLAVGLLQAAPG